MDAFNADPLNNSDHRLFAAGDIYLIYPDLKDAEDPAAHSSVRFEKLAEGVRDVAKYRWLVENYPDYENTLNRVLSNIGGDLTATVTKAQNKVNDLARKVAVLELVRAAEASEFAGDEGLTAAVAAARALLEKPSAKDEDLAEVAYGIALTLRTLSAPAETAPAETLPDTTSATSLAETSPAETQGETPTPKGGCASTMAAGTVGVLAATAVLTKTKKKEEDL